MKIKLFESFNTTDNKLTQSIENYIDKNSYFGFFPFYKRKLIYDSILNIDDGIVTVAFYDEVDGESIQLKFKIENNKVREVNI